MKRWKKKTIFVLMIITFLVSSVLDLDGASADVLPLSSEETWIIKWKDQADPQFFAISEVVDELPHFNAVVARPGATWDTQSWVNHWKHSAYVEYVQPNHKVEILAKPNDPLYSSQHYLRQIGAEIAWDTVKENRSITIAVIDTGVDLNHPDLKPNLVTGKNLIDPSKPPQDDNGHGTSVAGVLAAVGNNQSGVTGVVWRTRVMPIKALDKNGSGDESKLGEGIRYAVDNGAQIIVLSLGLYKYSPFLKEATQYAENRNVLLIAASGNDGQAVKYPAAYPTVLAVGGVNRNNLIMGDSNYGSEIDVVAPWSVYTTALGGSYREIGGTSMAAPQVAGVAALILSKYPNMKPYQVRNLIRQTAQDIGAQGWDERSGYGLVRADRALTQTPSEDIYENNNTRSQAKILPLDTMISASLSSESDQDWFMITPPYSGKVVLEFQSDAANALSQVEVVHYTGNSQQGTIYRDVTKPITLSVTKQTSYIQIRSASGKYKSKVHYRLTSQFQIYRDAFEDNDKQYKAYVLPARDYKVTGTFHQLNDEDWYMIPITQPGTLQVKVTPNTYRMDLDLWVQKSGERTRPINRGWEGESEISPILDVTSGKYYIRVRNIISNQAYPVTGEYELEITYKQKLIDPYEPNDRVFQATPLTLNANVQGLIHTQEDIDWFMFRTQEDNFITIQLSNIPRDRIMAVSLLDQNQKQLNKDINIIGQTSLQMGQVLPKGTYYVRLSADQGFQHQLYRLNITAERMVSGYRDIYGHWAQKDIVKLTQRGIVQGYPNYYFHPNRDITRAEAVAMIVKALGLTESKQPEFRDLQPSHWAYKEIGIAVQAGIVSGYPDGTFKPNQPTNRAEMAVMMANALGIKADASIRTEPFQDVDAQFWAYGVLQQMKSLGWIEGYPDQTFRPMNKASRAEFVTFLTRVFQF